MKKPLILITNDDGIEAPGLRKLITIMRNIGDVVVVAPEEPQSAMSHSITTRIPLKYKSIEISKNYKEYSLNGTPVDCIKFALHQLMDQKPDLVVSGINHGSNASSNVIYSGTMAAAIEAAIGGIPGIGFSLLDYKPDANFEYTEKYIQKIVYQVLENGLKPQTALNVNFPKELGKDYKGLKICRQSNAYWKEDFDERFDPRDGTPYYWLKGTFHLLEYSTDTDEWALRNYYVSMVPIQFDFTDHKSINELKHFEELCKNS